VNVLPHVHFRPVGERENTNALAGMNAGVVTDSTIRALVLRIPLARAVAEGINALLGARLFFIAARAAKCCIEFVVG